jgi:hypothetical protein
MPRVRMIVGRYGLFQPTHLSRLTAQNRRKAANSSRMNSSFGQPAGPRWNEFDETQPYRSVTESPGNGTPMRNSEETQRAEPPHCSSLSRFSRGRVGTW